MNKRRGCGIPIAVTLSVLATLACVVLGGFAVRYIRQQQLLAQSEPPSVTITYPASGTSTLAGSYLPVSATAFGGVPIRRAELWLDGQLIDTQESRLAEGISPFYVSFDLNVPQGLHTLWVRAVDATGLMGDSWPVNVGGVKRPSADEPARLVTVQEGDTLEDIAAAYNADPDTVRQLNPGLGDQEPPVGSEVVLPPPQSKAAPGPEGPPVGPTLPPGEDQPPGSKPLAPPTGTRLGALSPVVGITIGSLDILQEGSPPAAPTDLQAEVTGCNIRLRWNDNADNEGRYEVWYLWNLSQDPRVIAELEPAAGGQAWFEFPAPDWGAFIFWVEAVNSWGRQPSNKAGALVVEGDCPQTLATHLQVEALDMSVPAGYDEVYCYLSFEGAPHVRVPDAGGNFFNDFVQSALWGDNFPLSPSGDGRLVVPIPADESLEVEGECWGWSGGKLSEIGPLSGEYPRQTWDGARRSLAGDGLEIGVAIQPLAGALDTSGLMTTFSYEDPMMPVPYDVFEDMVRSWRPIDPLTRSLSWKWDGDPNKISGFQILLNGVPYNTGGGWSLVGPTDRSALVKLPHECGGRISWQVRAVAGQAQSNLSALTPDNDYDLPQCPEYAMVTFHSIEFDDCDDLDPAWLLALNGQTKQFYESCDTGLGTLCMRKGPHFEDDCGPHFFASLGQGMDPHPDTLVAPITLGEIHVETKAVVWDVFSGDTVAAHWQPWDFSSLEEAQQEVGCGKDVCDWLFGPTLCYTLYIFPQPEGSNCPVARPAYIP
ncbi:MAG: LysM peptidoglycan-binding domain-containing protein [Anaerolineae bacterium]|nr:LysM peptidoglycan-binding domain-containing protein [Anaerolineae bacterium]NIN93852.1 LysM peptidoglycan-binding domain-containing protein [Anaerolineae bacterium]NIQ76887.1 LysM peptidoglycan-binding domain-containing protein [Anaerolineae bacterium]